ncbi:MAG: hypothetical protein AAF744_10945 [Pseudomonadota bacterium]
MLLKIIPAAAILLTLLAVLASLVWRPYDQSGLFSANHIAGGLF